MCIRVGMAAIRDQRCDCVFLSSCSCLRTCARVCACLWCVRACVLCLVSSCASTVRTLLVIDNLPLFHFSSFNCLWVFLQESLDLVYLFVNKEFNECSRREASSVLHVSVSALFWLLYLVTVPWSNLLWWKMRFWFDIFVKCYIIWADIVVIVLCEHCDIAFVYNVDIFFYALETNISCLLSLYVVVNKLWFIVKYSFVTYNVVFS